MAIHNTEDAIYNQIKNTIGFEKSKYHLQRIGSRNLGKVLHHPLGAYSQSKKTTDYSVFPVTPEEHERAEKDKSGFFIENIGRILRFYMETIRDLEEELKNKK